MKAIPAHVLALAKHGAKFAVTPTMKAHAAKLGGAPAPQRPPRQPVKADMTGSMYAAKGR